MTLVLQTFTETDPKFPSSKIHIRELDLSKKSSIETFTTGVKSEFPITDILVNNAGIFPSNTRLTTEDGFELTFMTNYLGPFYLTHLLIDNILASNNKPRIVNVSSEGHRRSVIDFEDLQYGKENAFGAWTAYGQSKLGNVLFTNSLSTKYKGRVNTYSLHPGVVKTDISNEMPVRKIMGMLMWNLIGM